jgi:hypothetical protein
MSCERERGGRIIIIKRRTTFKKNREQRRRGASVKFNILSKMPTYEKYGHSIRTYPVSYSEDAKTGSLKQPAEEVQKLAFAVYCSLL